VYLFTCKYKSTICKVWGKKGVKIIYTVSIKEIRGTYSTIMIQQSYIWEQFSKNINTVFFVIIVYCNT